MLKLLKSTVSLPMQFAAGCFKLIRNPEICRASVGNDGIKLSPWSYTLTGFSILVIVNFFAPPVVGYLKSTEHRIATYYDSFPCFNALLSSRISHPDLLLETVPEIAELETNHGIILAWLLIINTVYDQNTPDRKPYEPDRSNLLLFRDLNEVDLVTDMKSRNVEMAGIFQLHLRIDEVYSDFVNGVGLRLSYLAMIFGLAFAITVVFTRGCVALRGNLNSSLYISTTYVLIKVTISNVFGFVSSAYIVSEDIDTSLSSVLFHIAFNAVNFGASAVVLVLLAWLIFRSFRMPVKTFLFVFVFVFSVVAWVVCTVFTGFASSLSLIYIAYNAPETIPELIRVTSSMMKGAVNLPNL